MARAEAPNLASYGTLSASSEERYRGNTAAKAVDGNPSTRWCANGAVPNSWLALDLGSPCQLQTVRIHWEQKFPAYIYEYRVEGSVDGKTWTELVKKTTGQKRCSHEVHGTWRQLRVVHLNPDKENWSSIWELEVLGLPGGS